MGQDGTIQTAKTALAYRGTIFALGFVLGTVRTLWLAPEIGETRAVLLELPVMLAASEAVLVVTIGEGLTAWIDGWATVPGALGLAGQVAFGLMPVLVRLRRH